MTYFTNVDQDKADAEDEGLDAVYTNKRGIFLLGPKAHLMANQTSRSLVFVASIFLLGFVKDTMDLYSLLYVYLNFKRGDFVFTLVQY